MHIKYKGRPKKRITNITVVSLLILLFTISIGYSFWSDFITIRGNILGLYYTVPYKGNDSNQVGRYTSNSDFKYLWEHILRVTSENYQRDTLTTNLSVVYKQALSTSNAEGTITLTLKNDTNYTFTNGKMELIEKVDNGGSIKGNSHNVGATQINSGTSINPTVTVKIASRDVASGTYLKYKITFIANGNNIILYYVINIIPK